MKILVVEDDHETAKYLKASLSSAGQFVDCAADGSTGWQMAMQGEYDLLVVDRMLPHTDGISLVGNLRQRVPKTTFSNTSKACRCRRWRGDASRPHKWDNCSLCTASTATPCCVRRLSRAPMPVRWPSTLWRRCSRQSAASRRSRPSAACSPNWFFWSVTTPISRHWPAC
ncbi:response regulator [Dyella mobilis]|uniref:Response regulator n=1 Tax=Dyella mobilis TaxID=1849582 RepID=A0ABS2KFR5_9GAMM|nr:response regulator [Dyella mobilis]